MGIPFSWSSFLGVALVVAGAALYALRSLRPTLARDYDIFFSAIALLCGGILFFQGWRQDPILQFGQFLLAGSACFFAVESIRLRSVATEQAKRNTPIVDDERPVSRVYRAELDELSPAEDRPVRRRIQGTRDPRSSRTDEYYDETPRRRSSTRGTDERLSSGSDRPRKRRTRPPENRPITTTDEWDDADDFTEEKPPRRSSPARPTSRGSDSSPRSNRRPRPAQDDAPPSREPRNTEPPSDYVDYKPVDPDESDNWGDY